ncbi:MAG: pentapeptide repeat-containing protein, partial [Planctomycetota bacterium]
ANLRAARLEGADLFAAHLEKANLRRARLEGATLHDAHLEGAILHSAHLEKADLRSAHLEGADLAEAHLERADLTEAHLEGALFLVANGRGRLRDLVWPYYPIPYRLDRTFTRNTVFHPRARDPWSVLRRNYTGPNMIFVLLFTLVAFLPVIAKTTFWSAVSRWEEAAAPAALDAVQRTSALLAKTPNPAWTPWTEKAQTFVSTVGRERMTPPQVRETLRLLAESGAVIEAFRRQAGENAAELEELKQVESWVTQAQEAVRILAPASERLKVRRVLSLVLGTHDGWLVAFLTGALLFYNAVRAVLTYRVGPLRDDEERVGVSPAWDDYKWLWRWHQITSPLLVMSIMFGLWRILSSLFTTVLVPA